MPVEPALRRPAPARAQERVWRPGWPVDVARVLGSLRRGGADPAYRLLPDGALWRVTRTPLGAATVRLVTRRAETTVTATAWGPGAGWVLDRLPTLLGDDDDPAGFEPRHPVVHSSWRRHGAGIRTPRTGLVLESLVPSILEQKVTGAEARRSWARLLRRFGEPAPGPAPEGMHVPPDAAVWRGVPSWEWHRAGVGPQRSRTIVTAAGVAGRLEQVVAMTHAAAEQRLTSVPGIGPWTAAEVHQRALGDPDAVSVGDFHLAGFVGWALVGAPLDDDGMLEVLAPYAGHRYRVIRLLELSGARKPRFAPRLSPQDFRAL